MAFNLSLHKSQSCSSQLGSFHNNSNQDIDSKQDQQLKPKVSVLPLSTGNQAMQMLMPDMPTVNLPSISRFNSMVGKSLQYGSNLVNLLEDLTYLSPSDLQTPCIDLPSYLVEWMAATVYYVYTDIFCHRLSDNADTEKNILVDDISSIHLNGVTVMSELDLVRKSEKKCSAHLASHDLEMTNLAKCIPKYYEANFEQRLNLNREIDFVGYNASSYLSFARSKQHVINATKYRICQAFSNCIIDMQNYFGDNNARLANFLITNHSRFCDSLYICCKHLHTALWDLHAGMRFETLHKLLYNSNTISSAAKQMHLDSGVLSKMKDEFTELADKIQRITQVSQEERLFVVND